MTLEQKIELFIFLIKNQDSHFYNCLRYNVTTIFQLLEFCTTSQQIYDLILELINVYYKK